MCIGKRRRDTPAVRVRVSSCPGPTRSHIVLAADRGCLDHRLQQRSSAHPSPSSVSPSLPCPSTHGTARSRQSNVSYDESHTLHHDANLVRETVSKIGTDMPVALSATGRGSSRRWPRSQPRPRRRRFRGRGLLTGGHLTATRAISGAEVRPLVACETRSGDVDATTRCSRLDRRRQPMRTAHARALRLPPAPESDPSGAIAEKQPPRVTPPIPESLPATSGRKLCTGQRPSHPRVRNVRLRASAASARSAVRCAATS